MSWLTGNDVPVGTKILYNHMVVMEEILAKKVIKETRNLMNCECEFFVEDCLRSNNHVADWLAKDTLYQFKGILSWSVSSITI